MHAACQTSNMLRLEHWLLSHVASTPSRQVSACKLLKPLQLEHGLQDATPKQARQAHQRPVNVESGPPQGRHELTNHIVVHPSHALQ